MTTQGNQAENSSATTEPTDRDVARDMGARLIRQLEGCTLKPEPDTPPHWQIGYGCNTLADGAPVTADTPPLASVDEAEALLQAKLTPLAEQVDGMIHVAVAVGQRAALYSFSWNIGISALEHSSLIRRLNAEDFAAAAACFPEWIYAGGKPIDGLRNRRALERAVFEGSVVP